MNGFETVDVTFLSQTNAGETKAVYERERGHPAIRVNREVLQIGAKGGIISSKSLNFGTFSLIIVEGKK